MQWERAVAGASIRNYLTLRAVSREGRGKARHLPRTPLWAELCSVGHGRWPPCWGCRAWGESSWEESERGFWQLFVEASDEGAETQINEEAAEEKTYSILEI